MYVFMCMNRTSYCTMDTYDFQCSMCYRVHSLNNSMKASEVVCIIFSWLMILSVHKTTACEPMWFISIVI